MENSVTGITPDFESGNEGSTPSSPETTSSSWNSYPQIYALGHRYLEDLLKDPVLVEEKIDGSQFSFGRFPAKAQEFRPEVYGAVGETLNILTHEQRLRLIQQLQEAVNRSAAVEQERENRFMRYLRSYRSNIDASVR